MKIKIICNNNELLKTTEIQEVFDTTMRDLLKRGFTGEMTIENKTECF